jgi:hypothetical protein
MKRRSRRTSSIAIAVTALCFVWLLSGHIIPVPAFAEGSGAGPCPIEILPADTTVVTAGVVAPNGGSATTCAIEVVVLFLSAAL